MSEQTAERTGTAGDLVVRAVLRTDVGLVRSENQDFGTFTNTLEEVDSLPQGRLLVVADGMGGHRGGATASRLAVETLKAQFLGSETPDIGLALREALTRANSRVFSEAQANPDLRGMGTTTSALAMKGREGWFAHVGDSRIYLVRGGEIRQLTDDHSLVASMVREGLLTKEEAENHPRRNVLQRSVGVSEYVDIDVRGPFPLRVGDTFIVCSDGLHGLVKEPEIREIAKLSIQEAADVYVQRALDRGAPDNVTVIVARIERADGSDEPDPLDDAQTETLTVDPAAFEETVRETHLPDSSTNQAEVDTAPIPAVQEPAQAQALVQAPAEPAAAEATAPAPQSRPLSLIWMFIGAVVLGLAGWWLLYWAR